jgi:large subunit ribosomal protein L32
MAVPKKRTSKSRKGMRRAHDHLTFVAAVEVCPKCGEPKLRHRVCAECGTYRGQQVIPPRTPAS